MQRFSFGDVRVVTQVDDLDKMSDESQKNSNMVKALSKGVEESKRNDQLRSKPFKEISRIRANVAAHGKSTPQPNKNVDKIIKAVIRDERTFEKEQAQQLHKRSTQRLPRIETQTNSVTGSSDKPWLNNNEKNLKIKVTWHKSRRQNVTPDAQMGQESSLEISYTTGEEPTAAFNVNRARIQDEDQVGQMSTGGDSFCDVTRESFWPVAIRYLGAPLDVGKPAQSQPGRTELERVNSSDSRMQNEMNQSKMLIAILKQGNNDGINHIN